jgi:hypothetical protein
LLNAARLAGFAAADQFTRSADESSRANSTGARRIFPGGARKPGILTGFGATRNKLWTRDLNGADDRNRHAIPPMTTIASDRVSG